MKNYESLTDALNDLRKRGYDADFEPKAIYLYCDDLDLRLYEEEFHIDEVYHFEVGSKSGDYTVIYALTTPTGVKGTIVYENGAPSDNINFDMARKLQGHSDITSK